MQKAMGRNPGFAKLNLGAKNPMEISIILPGILCPVSVSEFSSVRETSFHLTSSQGCVLDQVYRTGNTDGDRAIPSFRVRYVEGLFLKSLSKKS